MHDINSLIQRLNPLCQQSLEQAIAECVKRQHYNVELEHWLWALLQLDNPLLNQLLLSCQINQEQLAQDLNVAFEKYKKGNEQTPALSPRLIEWINEAWLLTSLEYQLSHITPELLFAALGRNPLLHQLSLAISRDMQKIDWHRLQHILHDVIDQDATNVPAIKQEQRAVHALAQYANHLNQQASEGKIDPVIGRDDEIRQVIDILSRRRQNNAILLGEPGVGKTAIAEGLALKIVQNDVPDFLKNVQTYTLDLSLLQAGAGVKGEFEQRLHSVIDDIKQSDEIIILFIDEAHTLIGAGGEAGQNDAANILKPALARGELRCIAATTWREYKQYFEKDAALTRRFQIIKIAEPTAQNATHMLRSIQHSLEQHHKVRITSQALAQAASLSERYISGRQLPDKAISVLDTACARVARQQTTTPASIAQVRESLRLLNEEREQLLLESRLAFKHDERLAEIEQLHQQMLDKEQQLNTQWQQEKTLISRLLTLTQQLQQEPVDDMENLQIELRACENELRAVQAEQAIMQVFVNEHAVAEVIADWTGIPLGKMLDDAIKQGLNRNEYMKQRIIGQDHAIDTICEQLQIAQTNLQDPDKPQGVFLFVGPSGVGKTETALAIAEQVYGSRDHMTVINMTEFKEAHKVSLLAGAPPGYVGYGEGGILTEAVRRQPYSLILLDEIEKAHSSVQEMFYQVFDKGILRDSQGRDINFKHSTIILTANTASDIIEQYWQNQHGDLSIESLLETIYPTLISQFKPAFLGRLRIIPYLPLNHKNYQQIMSLKLAKIQQRLQINHKLDLAIDNSVYDFILGQVTKSSLGARQIDNMISQVLLPDLAQDLLHNMLEDKHYRQLVIRYGVESGLFNYSYN